VVNGGPLPEAVRAELAPVPTHLLLEDGQVDPALGSAPPAPLRSAAPGASALVLYTSGSTGRPRGVVQTHRNIAANTRSIVDYLALGPEDRALLVLPLSYCYGRSVLQTHLHVGGSVFLEGRSAFPRVVMETLASEGCTGFAGVPLTFELIRRQVDVAGMSFPRLRYLTQAGGAMAPETIAWAREAFQPARLFVMYGQTEATARLSYLPPERAEDKKGSIGIPIPGVRLAVVDDAGRELPPGETGHLVARGDNVTPGYLDEPEETVAILHGGWLWTGDLAFRDADGFFFHQGRAKEILKIGGHRVSPVEIEHVVAEHPDVGEAAVVGVPDALMGEVPAAFVVLKPGRSARAEEIRRFCRERMAPYRVPVRVTFLAVLPRNEAGKLLRARLAARPAGE
jgi:acyl-CoA synthetase (AMP-forming)/AMP-acid ligase II